MSKQYGSMMRIPVREDHYNRLVWVNPVTEDLRRRECLCYNCTKLVTESQQKAGDTGSGCPIAGQLYGVCKKEDVALVVTRCPEFNLKV
jgi:hypothetical protein